MRRGLAITLALFALLYVVARLRYAPPAAEPLDAPRDRFSATRARALQEKLVGDGSTRFIGTSGNARGRELAVAELSRLGWTVETQSAWSCTHHGMCGPVTNVIGRLAGREPALPGVLLTAHHDSVPASPGASDDGLGTTALLETARALTESGTPRRTVAVVLTDGEELGLLGANAFVREHPLAHTFGTTINVDARGSRGPSQMFETSAGNAWLVSMLGQSLRRPVTTSLFYEVYKTMPNDTDFSLTKTVAAGVNFANTAGIEDYHTTLDRLDTSDVGTLQQHGDNALAMARAFAEAGHPESSGTDAVWFDVLALGVVRYPARWSLLLALVALVLVAGHGLRARTKGLGLLVFVPALAAGGLAAAAGGWLLRVMGALPAPFVAHPHAALVTLFALAGAGALAVMLFFAGRAPARALWSGTWLGWGALGVATANVAPGASYLFVVPTLIAGLTGALPLAVASAAPAAVAATLVLALATGLYDTLGFTVAPVEAVPIVLLATTLAPMLEGLPTMVRRAPIALAGGGLASALVAMFVPAFSSSFPQRVNVIFRQDDDSARTFVDTTWGPSTWGKAPPAMLAAIGEPGEPAAALPWTQPSLFAPVSPLQVKPPVADILSVTEEGGRHHVRLRVRSQRGATSLAIVLPPRRRVEVKVEGRFADPRAVASGTVVGLVAVPESGVAVELDADPGAITITLLDRSFGVPSGTKAEAAVRARTSEATPFQDGDQTVVSTHLSL